MTRAPLLPYRGMQAFRYADHPIFFARQAEVERLARLVTVYRGVIVYGDSGVGKSSLINAGFLPQAIQSGLQPERVRLQPRPGEEFVVERIRVSDDDDRVLPSLFGDHGGSASSVVVPADAFVERVRSAADTARPLLIFDQFEEILTLFEAGSPYRGHEQVVRALLGLLRGGIAVRLVFVFREDYLGKVKDVLTSYPEIVDQGLRVMPVTVEALPAIIRGPFERFPGRFDHEFSPAFSERLLRAFADRFAEGAIGLSEVQVACLRLWQAPDPEALLETRGVEGLIEEYLGTSIEHLPPALQAPALDLLSAMVTSAGTRNVISQEDLIERVVDSGYPVAAVGEALEGLASSRLVQRGRRRDVDLYELTSESLIPWIRERGDELRHRQQSHRERRRLVLLFAVAMTQVALIAVIALLLVLRH